MCDSIKNLSFYEYIIAKFISEYAIKNNTGDIKQAKLLLKRLKKEQIITDNITYTYTFSESVENHIGMEQLGKKAKHGLSVEYLTELSKKLPNAELIKLEYPGKEKHSKAFKASDTYNTSACILVIRNGLNNLIDDVYGLRNYTKNLPIDKKFWHDKKKKVLNKEARWNLCFADFSQQPDYLKGKGTVIDFKDNRDLQKIRSRLQEMFNIETLLAELNYYYDIKKTGIGYHGDGERRIVIGMRLGSSMNLKYQWYYKTMPVGKGIEIILNEGDIYAMSDKAVGYDWKTQNIPTLRHAAGEKHSMLFEISKEEAIEWNTNKKINPKTNKPIKKDGPMYRKYLKVYKQYFTE